VFNPTSPVAALSLLGGGILAIMNSDKAQPGAMVLCRSDDEGQSWRDLHVFEDPKGDSRYPMMRRLAGGEIVLTFSHGSKHGISAFVFNDTWVMQQ
jgi:hypothetical protein